MRPAEISMSNANTAINPKIEIEKQLYKSNLKNNIQAGTKRVIDIIASLIGIVLLLLITLFVVICNFISNENGPIFFIQERIGKNGKKFKMYKFRTMVVNAEEILKQHIEQKTEIGKEYIKNKKIKDDPRITRIGRFLRNTSLDEFPQFLNVLKGEMSIVGPRPYLLREKEDMGETYDIIVTMKPGLTGPWQVAGRNNLGFKDRLVLDEKYYKEKSLGRDIKMIFATVAKIIKKEGAM